MNKYRVISNTDMMAFQDTINKLMSEGWVMVGGMSVCASEIDGNHVFYQAMVLIPKQIVQPNTVVGPTILLPRK